MKFSSDDEAELQIALKALAERKREADLAAEDLQHAQEQVTTLMARLQRKSYVHAGSRFTVVHSSAPKFDENGMRKAFGAKVFNKLTTAKLDGKKLAAAVDAGTLDPIVVAQYTEYVDRRPYIRITEDAK